ncbi:hypothetical protein AVEN_165036-1 [Araneus ventricosus]|uniref:Uncharacterized protein n=1 Tax=Araneus ventricosus TaxID=182803 RepID=A0A4Y2GJ31_ARAVE|nr:hypothetical protein AVEN_165036-1 [Araneus ventricosus]
MCFIATLLFINTAKVFLYSCAQIKVDLSCIGVVSNPVVKVLADRWRWYYLRSWQLEINILIFGELFRSSSHDGFSISAEQLSTLAQKVSIFTIYRRMKEVPESSVSHGAPYSVCQHSEGDA